VADADGGVTRKVRHPSTSRTTTRFQNHKKMKLLRDARTLKAKAVASLKVAMMAFNSYEDEGRICTVLLHLQHACEMLLKAVLVQSRVKVFDNGTGMSYGFEKCVRLCQANNELTGDEAGIMRSIDALRDGSQHWFIYVSEELLYMHTRALITAFDAYLKRSLADDLYSHIPVRVLPVSTKPTGDLEFLIDKEYKLIAELLKPGKRQRDEARARIRSMLAMEALVTDEVQISERDIDRIEAAVRAGEQFGRVFPRLITIATKTTGEGLTLTVKFSKKEGAPVRYVGGDDPTEAAAVREVDLRKKFHLRATELAKQLKITTAKAKALRWHLKIDDDEACCHVFEFGASKFACFSDNARNRISEAVAGGIDPDKVWKDYRAASG
jgi:hypothetical protein